MLTKNFLSEYEQMIHQDGPYYGVHVGTFRWRVISKKSKNQPISGTTEYYYCTRNKYPGCISKLQYDDHESDVVFSYLSNEKIFNIVTDRLGRIACENCCFIDDPGNVTYSFDQNESGIYASYWNKLSQSDINNIQSDCAITDVQPYLDYDGRGGAIRYSGRGGKRSSNVISNVQIIPDEHTIKYSTFVTVKDLEQPCSYFSAPDLRDAAFTNPDLPIRKMMDEIDLGDDFTGDPDDINMFAEWFKQTDEHDLENDGIRFDVVVDAENRTAQATVHIVRDITFTTTCDMESNNLALDRIAQTCGLFNHDDIYDAATGKKPCPAQLTIYLPRYELDSPIDNNGFMDIDTMLSREDLAELEKIARNASGLNYRLYLNDIKYGTVGNIVNNVSAKVTFGGVALIYISALTSEIKEFHSKHYCENDNVDSPIETIEAFPLKRPTWSACAPPRYETDDTKIELAMIKAKKAIEKPLLEMIKYNIGPMG